MAEEQQPQTVDVENVRYLNQDAGALSKELGLISDKTEELVGDIQKQALAITILYQNGDDAYKAQLEKASLIVDDKNRDGEVVGKKFNNGLLFQYKDSEIDTNPEIEPEELLENISEALGQEILNAKPSKIQDLEKATNTANDIVDSKSGVQAEGRPFVPPANQIIGLAATEESKQFRDAILPIQAFVRSNYVDFPTQDLGLDGKEFNFNIPTLGFLPDNVKEVIDAGRRMSEAHAAGEMPNEQDVKTLEGALDIAIENLNKINADLSPFVAHVEQLKTESASLSWDDVLKAKAENDALQQGDETEVETAPLAGLSLIAGNGEDASEEDSEAEQDSEQKGFLAGLVDKAKDTIKNFQNDGLPKDASRLDRYLHSLEKAQGVSFDASAKQAATANGNLAWMSDTLDVQSVKKGKAVFVDNVQGHRIDVTPTTISHHDNDGKFSMEEALQYVSLAAANPQMMKKGITISGGTAEQQAMIVVASKILQKSGQITPKINNLESIKPEIIAQVGQKEISALQDKGIMSEDNVIDFPKAERSPQVQPQSSKQEIDGDAESTSPTADELKKAFGDSANLSETAYDTVKQHVLETGKATNAVIKEALKTQTGEISTVSKAFDEAKELLKSEKFIEEVPHAGNTRLVVNSNNAPKPAGNS